MGSLACNCTKDVVSEYMLLKLFQEQGVLKMQESSNAEPYITVAVYATLW